MAGGHEHAFDFGSGMSLPPSRSEIVAQQHDLPGRPRQARGQIDVADQSGLQSTTLSRVRSLFSRADKELLGYLKSRSISPWFLKDIDGFMAAHPELVQHHPTWCHEFAVFPPLQAYFHFVKGYLRPARYNDNALPRPETIVIPRRPVELQYNAFDTELLDFFSDVGRCWDVLREMDKEVMHLADVHHKGKSLFHYELKLMALHMHGQPVDALKFYRYCYRPALGAHGEVEEHDILRHSQETTVKEDEQPQPCMRFIKHSFRWVRNAMAKANDRQEDVTVVLLDCFTGYLRRQRAVPRKQHVHLRNVARDMIENQRIAGGNVDIVDLVMNLAIDLFKGLPYPHSKHAPPVRRNVGRRSTKARQNAPARRPEPPQNIITATAGKKSRKKKKKSKNKNRNRNKNKNKAKNATGLAGPRGSATSTIHLFNSSASAPTNAIRTVVQVPPGAAGLAVAITQTAISEVKDPAWYKLNDSEVDFFASNVRQAYSYALQYPGELDVPREVLVEEHNLALAVGCRAMARGLMNDAEYSQLNSIFPQRAILGDQDWSNVNPHGYSVLVLLDKWL